MGNPQGMAVGLWLNLAGSRDGGGPVLKPLPIKYGNFLPEGHPNRAPVSLPLHRVYSAPAGVTTLLQLAIISDFWDPGMVRML